MTGTKNERGETGEVVLFRSWGILFWGKEFDFIVK